MLPTRKTKRRERNSPLNNKSLPNRKRQWLSTVIARVEFLAVGEGAAVVHVDGVAGLGSAGALHGVGGFDVEGGGEGEGGGEEGQGEVFEEVHFGLLVCKDNE